MGSVDKDIERLIVRRLDGTISDDENLELNRELIRNPDAHQLMEEYGRIDELASEALHRAVDADRLSFDPLALPERSEARTRVLPRWTWQLATGAIAASLLAVLVARIPPSASSTDHSVADRQVVLPIPTRVSPTPTNSLYPEGLIRNVGTRVRPKIRRDTGREVFGVVGDDGNVYWIGVDRTRTTKVHRSERM